MTGERRLLLLVPTVREAELLLAQPPTDQKAVVQIELPGAPVAAICGFGIAAAGAGAAWYLANRKASSCLLVGAAGGFAGRVGVGELVHGVHARLHGVGAGRGESHEPAGEMPFDLLPELPGEPLELAAAPVDGLVSGDVVSVTAASAGAAEAEELASRFRLAVAEDMETWSVAAACHLAGTPLLVVRAVTNVAGDRDHGNWRMEDAMVHLREALPSLLAGLP